MDLHERHQRILAELQLHGSVSVSDFSERTGVSPMTIRRDLRILGDEGRLRRVHGGALPVDATAYGSTSRQRMPLGPPKEGSVAEPLFTLGMVVPNPGYYFPRIITGAQERARALGGRVVLGSSQYDRRRERRQLERMIETGVNGLLVTTTEAEDFPALAYLAETSVPVVIIERSVEHAPVGDHLESVRSDHAAGSMIAVRHLAELGHERIGFWAYTTPTAKYLRPGFERAMEQLDLNPGMPSMVVPALDEPEAPVRQFLRDSLDAGVTAIIVHEDRIATEMTSIALDMGLGIPEDLSVVTYDDQIADLAAVPLTAITPPGRDLGRLATSMAFERLTHVETISASRHVALRPALTRRSSTGPPR